MNWGRWRLTQNAEGKLITDTCEEIMVSTTQKQALIKIKE